MRNSMDKVCVTWLLILLKVVVTNATDSSPDPRTSLESPHSNNDRTGRSWHHPALFGPQMLLPHQQQPLPAASTSQPGDTSTGNNQIQPESTGSNWNFEDPHDKMSVPAASEMDYMARQFGYLNVHRFDPNYMNYYERQAYPRFPSPQAPRFGPGYRKDKYGHGYGYSCKQGDDCDEVRAANQLAARNPAPPPHHQHPMMQFNNHYPDLPPFPSMPSPYSSLIPPSPPSYNQPQHNPYFGGPALFNDPHSMSSMIPPPRYYHGRYLHDQVEDRHPQQKSDAIPPNADNYQGRYLHDQVDNRHLQQKSDGIPPNANNYQGRYLHDQVEDRHPQQKSDGVPPNGDNYQGRYLHDQVEDRHLQQKSDGIPPNADNYKGRYLHDQVENRYPQQKSGGIPTNNDKGSPQ